MTKMYELSDGHFFCADVDKNTKICNVAEPQLDILIYDFNNYAEMCKHAIFYSEDATNGDMIETTFPNVESRLDEKTNTIIVEWPDGTTKAFKAEWWNAPYK